MEHRVDLSPRALADIDGIVGHIHQIALASFAAGAVLIGLGIWSSMSTKPEGYAPEARAAGAPPPSAAIPA